VAGAASESPAPLVLSYRASSWTQVRDGKGQIILLRTVPAGSEQAIRGTPPFDIVLGNARAVTIVYRGQPVDVARYSHQNIARLRLQ
jgi:cytoskeleton protein RodZ